MMDVHTGLTFEMITKTSQEYYIITDIRSLRLMVKITIHSVIWADNDIHAMV